MDQFEAVFDHSMDEIFMFDSVTLTFQRANLAARKDLGQDIEALRNMTPLDIIPSLTRESLQGMLEKLRGGKEDRIEFEAHLRRMDGRKFPARIILFGPADDNPGLFFAIARDMSHCLTPQQCSKMSRKVSSGEEPVHVPEKVDESFAEKPVPLASMQLPRLRISSALARVGGNELLYLKLCKKFKDHYGGIPKELKIAIDGGHRSQAQAIIHRIKGVAANIGAEDLADEAARLGSTMKDRSMDEARELWMEFETVFLSTIFSMEKLLDSFLEDRERSPANKIVREPIDKNRVISLLNELEGLLVEDLVLAARRVKNLKELLKNTELFREILKIEKFMKIYQTEMALYEISGLLRHLGAPEEKPSVS